MSEVLQTEGLRLVAASRDLEPGLRDMWRDFHDHGDPHFDECLAHPERYFRRLERFAAGVGLPADRVQQTEFFLMRAERILAGARLRHRLIPVLERDGGNIGYEVRPSERRRGYGTRLLALMLEEAARLGLERALLTVEPSNSGSVRIIEKNGGVPGRQTRSPATGALMQQYWIDLPPR